MTNEDEAVARVAEGQHGAFTRRQARAQGMSRRAIDHRLACGRWEPVAADVCRFPGTPRTWRHDVAVAVLGRGPATAAGFRTAAALLDINGYRPGPIEVVRARGSDHDAVIGTLHETTLLPPSHLVVVDGIVTTSTVRTVFDLAGRQHPARTERMLDDVLARNGALLHEFHRMLGDLARRGRPGIALMRELLLERGPGYVAPASQLEALAIRILREHGLPEPIRQFSAGDGEKWVGYIDLAFPIPRVLIEVDSRRHHTMLLDLERDAVRHAELSAAGWRLVPVRHQVLQTRPWYFADLVRRAIRVDTARTTPNLRSIRTLERAF